MLYKTRRMMFFGTAIDRHPALVSFFGAWSTKRFILDKQQLNARTVGDGWRKIIQKNMGKTKTIEILEIAQVESYL